MKPESLPLSPCDSVDGRCDLVVHRHGDNGGYRDVSPVTTEGRMIAVVLEIVGIGFLAMFTATLTSCSLNGNSLQIRPSSSASIGSKPRSTR